MGPLLLRLSCQKINELIHLDFQRPDNWSFITNGKILQAFL
jgi:hypothetical protein